MINKNIAKITIGELVSLQEKTASVTLREGIEVIRQFKDSAGLSEQEAMAVGRMALKFNYDAPRN